jgi:photosystem II stability/assembly factor-like uncharacterized protein
MNIFKAYLILFIILILVCPINSQNFWEYKGLENSFIGYITKSDIGTLYASEWQGLGDSVFFSIDNGEHWLTYGEISDSAYINISSIITLDGNKVIVSAWSENGGIYKSTDGSLTWTSKNNGLRTNDVSKIIKTTYGLVAGTYDGIYLSVDEGENWEQLNEVPDTIVDVRDVAISKEGILFAANFDNIFKSNDNGITWETANNGIFGFNFICLIISENNNLYLGTRRDGIFRSTNLGDSWQQVKQGWIRNIASNSLGYVMVGEEIEGVVLSKDNGESWKQIIEGLPNPIFVNSTYFDQQGYAYCSVHNFGIYRSSSSTVSAEVEFEILNNFHLEQNYPNPFNPVTRIKFEILGQAQNDNALVTLKVYDILGKEVVTLVNEEKPAGNYEVEFNVGQDSSPDIASGIYFYRLQAGSFVETKKMILLR